MKKLRWMMILLTVFWYLESYNSMTDVKARLNQLGNLSTFEICSYRLVDDIYGNYDTHAYWLIYAMDTEKDDPFRSYSQALPPLKTKKVVPVPTPNMNVTPTGGAE